MKVGQACSFYHEGGHGSQYWARGWRYGIIRAVPTKGQRLRWMQIEVSGGYKAAPDSVWVHSDSVNEPGDTIYHGQKLREVVANRKERKAVQQAKANKRAKR
jgi:hypothetical protein